MPLRHLPIQRKLVGFIFLTTLTVLIGSYLVLFFYESRISERATAQSLTTMADIIAANSTAALIYDDQNLAQEILSGLRAEKDITAAALFDKEGQLYAVYPAGLLSSSFPKKLEEDGARFSFSGFTLFRPIVQGRNRVGTVYIKSDLNDLHRRLRIYGLVLVCVLVGAGVLAYYLSAFLQRQITQPILNLAEAAKAVSERKDYTVRAAKRTGDELGFVTDAFNAMLEQIQLNHAALGESEARFRVVADNAPVLIWMAGSGMVATWFNRYWMNFVGKPMEEQVGLGWIESVHPEDREKLITAGTAALEEQKYFRSECRLRRYDGEYRWFLNQGTPRYQGGAFMGLIGSCVDITDNKEAEATVRISELQMRLVTEKAPVFMCQIDRNHRYKFASRAFARRYGLEPGEVTGRHVSEIVGISAYDSVRENLVRAFEGIRQEFEVELQYPNLGLRWIHLVFEPDRSEEGRVDTIVAVLTDLTERQQAAKELERARDEAVNASRAKDDFLAALSHELRTPLNPVLLLATDAASNPNLSPQIREDFEMVRKHIELEARLIDDLLDLTYVAKGKMNLANEHVDVGAAIKDALDTVSAEIASRRINLIVNLAPRGSTVLGDPVRLRQVFWNIFRNAVKFTPDGGRIAVTSQTSPDKRIFRVQVADTGIGILSSELGTIFEAFTQGDHARGLGSHRFGGLGLGLAISRKLIELHKGRITASSGGRDRGSTFEIELPLFAGPNGSPAGSEEFFAASGVGAVENKNGYDERPRSILLIDDHAPTRFALERLLRRRRYRVLTCGSVAEARTIVKAERVDLVISDIGLPDGSGYDLMRELQDRFQLKGIALTGYGTESDIAKSHATGFVVHLTKPVSAQALDSAIASLSAANAEL